jgi:hypothetical protein
VSTAKPQPVDDDDDVNPYGVLKESEEELRLAEKNKPVFTDIADKFKKSARGPAQMRLVLPVNMLIAVGSLSGIAGVMGVIAGVWPLVFTDAPPSSEEYAERLVIIFMGVVMLIYGCLICFGASQMQSLESYAWALAGAVLAIPLLAGILALVVLRDPKVRDGFEEVEGALDETDEDGEEDEDEDEDEDDEEEDDEEEERPRRRGKR